MTRTPSKIERAYIIYQPTKNTHTHTFPKLSNHNRNLIVIVVVVAVIIMNHKHTKTLIHSHYNLKIRSLKYKQNRVQYNSYVNKQTNTLKKRCKIKNISENIDFSNLCLGCISNFHRHKPQTLIYFSVALQCFYGEKKTSCVGRESNPDQLLGRQLC